MAVGFSNTNKPINPRGNDASPKGYNRASLYSGKALDFDGVNDKVNITTDDIDLQEFSVVQYVNLGATAASKIFYSNYAASGNVGFATGISDSTANVPKFYTKGTSSDTLFGSFALNAGEWYQIVATYDGATKKIYVNGVLDTSVAFSDTIVYTNATNQIGALSGSIAQALDGQLSGFKIFNTALTAAQVADLYNNPEKVVPTGVDNTALKLWLPMQEGAGTTAYDGSGNGNHGTISGATYTHGIGAPVSQTAVIDWNKGTNLQLKSEDLTSAGGWLFGEITALADQTTAPDGQSTADELTETTTNATHWMFSTGGILTTTSGLDYTFSVFAKKGDGSAAPDILQLSYRSAGHGSSKYANFNLSTGAVTASSGGTASIVAHSNGWYRLIFTAAATASASGSGGVIAFTNDNATATRGTSYAGNTNANVFVWGASLTQSSSADSYVRVDLTAQTSDVLLPQGLTTGRDITGVNLFENVRKQGALNLDGNSWAEVHKNASLEIGTGDFSVEAWFPYKFLNKGSYANIVIALNDADSIGIKTINGAIQVQDGNGSRNYSSAVENQIYHVVATRTGGTLYMYVDGAFFSSTSTTSPSINATENTAIGADVSAGTARLYSAWIAQPRIYNRALTAAEVLRNYNSGKNTYTND